MSGRAGGFAITVSVIDSATKRLEEINKSLERVHAPTERLQRQFSKLAETTGIRELGHGMREFAASSLEAFENVGRLVAPLGAITGGASIAGILELAHRWAELGSEIEHTATRAGMSAGKLSALQGAARLAGSSAEGLSSGMKTLNDNLFNAAAGRAPEAVMAFSYLGISVKDMTGHVKSATDALPEVADKIAAIKNPTMQAQIATMMFGGAAEDLLPFLRKGAAGIAEYTAAAKRYGAISDEDAAKADDLRRKQTELALAVTGLSNVIMADLQPAMSPMLHGMAEWIADNRELLGQRVADWIKTTVPEIISFAHATNDAVQALGGWKEVGLEAILIRYGGLFGRIAASAMIIKDAVQSLSNFAERKIFGEERTERAARLTALGPFPAREDIDYAMRGPLGQTDEQRRAWLEMDRLFAPPGAAPGALPHPGLPNPPLSGPNRMPGTSPAAADVTMTPTRRAFLDTLAGPESGGRYDIRNGGATFTGNQFPEGVGPGGTSTAAGRYQFISSTWHEQQARLGLSDFSPGNQDKAAWDLASNTYRNWTGHSLDDDLKAGKSADIAAALGSVWPSLPGGSQSRETLAQFDAAMKRNLDAETPPAQVAQAPPAQVANGAGTPPAPSTTTVRGSADLNIKLDGFPLGTRTTATTSGDLFSGAPRVEQAMTFP